MHYANKYKLLFERVVDDDYLHIGAVLVICREFLLVVHIDLFHLACGMYPARCQVGTNPAAVSIFCRST